MKVLNKRDLPEERPSTLDETGKRVYIFPEKVRGFFRKLRTLTQAVLIVILLVLPWIKINGYQALLLDIPNRKFSIFGLTFWAHDGPLIFFILAILTIGLAFITAVYGRVWCGWGCPQTVFVDGVFRRIEYLIMGSHIKQMNLAKAPWSGEKILKYSLTWILFTIVSLIITHSFLAYFVGAERLVEMTQHNPGENWTIFLFMFFITSFLLFDFGWFREQFCIIMCPYGRIQSVLMDDDSVTVAYDYNRGEPRKGKVVEGEQQGDCIDCYKCVSVCPTGIDIRRGLQMECVGCTACIDACDEVMEHVSKPKGLIRYVSGSSLKGLKAGFLKPRTAVYSVLLLLILSLLVINVSRREEIMVTILRGKDLPYQVVQEGEDKKIINHFKLHIKNQTFEDTLLGLKVSDDWKNENIEIISQKSDINIVAGKDITVHFFLKFPQEIIDGTGVKSIEIDFVDLQTNGIRSNRKVKLIGPMS
ncbi:MAG: cytochrome c oxidase accessory protein CcoG [Candidatus Dadabacteria bacterium]|nr:cytochrome c oxidase accessory protein CcoG [Candidatus Dadabacteria bacterium]NIS07348.1 cytochrome c oxidase accessory protein CcoG [Candidatus Dadabacteria bacterium]NIV41292.1 cytochrome c oxidase accessory protein CcoG [Candidatus Dadabacteria bacterium]NIX14527.1 cytochrome c oxidase accessory protein CcoG [Candidatus Dadabacteria bacterium]NIY20985.1 cytochrome c oxidase accessory protein CcoG [Candidatus Dadabacteria bacterium]